MAKISIPVKDYVDREVLHLSNKIDIRTELNKLALEKAEDEMDYKHEKMNEIRGQLNDQAATFAKVDNVELRFNTLEGKIETLGEKIDASDNRTNKYIGMIIGGFAVFQILIVMLFKFVIK